MKWMTMKKTATIAVLVVILAVIGSGRALAASITFSNTSNFLSATTASGPFDAPYSAVTSSPITFSSITVSPGTGASTIGVGNLLNTTLPSDLGVAGDNEFSNLDFTLSLPSTAFGFTVSSTDYERSPQNSIFEVRIFSNGGATLLDTASFTALVGGDAFFGIQSSSAFDLITIREISGGVQRDLFGPIDQEFFGQFYVKQVPEPSSILLLGSGLVGLGFVRRKFKA